MAEYIEKVEYIEKGALYEKIAELEEIARDMYIDTPWDSPARTRYQTQLSERTNLKHIIFDLPASDVAPVRHGRWIENYGAPNVKRCSVCKAERHAKESWWSYCPNCGAKMVGKAGEQE